MFVNVIFGKNENMIDIKAKLVLKILAQECSDGNYKIVEVPDIIMALPKRYRMDSEAIKHILTHLERQDMISIKYDDDDVYCLAVLPYGFESMENEKPIPRKQEREKQKKLSTATILLSFASALTGTILGIIICHFLLKIF